MGGWRRGGGGIVEEGTMKGRPLRGGWRAGGVGSGRPRAKSIFPPYSA